MAGYTDPRPDTLMQTDQSRTTITLADGAGHTFELCFIILAFGVSISAPGIGGDVPQMMHPLMNVSVARASAVASAAGGTVG